MGRWTLCKYSLKTSQNFGGNCLVLNGFFCARKFLFQRIDIDLHFTGWHSSLGYLIIVDFLSPIFPREKYDLLNKISISSKARWIPSSKYINIQCVIFYQRWNIYTLKSFTPGNKRTLTISTTTHSLVIRSLHPVEPALVHTTAAYTYNGYVSFYDYD